MSAEDHAILIGISRYPELGEGGKSADLQGPGTEHEGPTRLDPAWRGAHRGPAFMEPARLRKSSNRNPQSRGPGDASG